jgi:hypothetical protein
MALIITGNAIGKRRPLFEDFSVPAPPDITNDEGGGGLTLRELIAHVVRHEVAAFRKRQEARKFLRVLSERQIEAGVERGPQPHHLALAPIRPTQQTTPARMAAD